MASLDPRDVALNKYLADYALGYRPEGMIASQVFPVVGVTSQTGTQAVMVRDHWMRPASTIHVPGERPKTSLITTTTVSYFCAGYAFGANGTYELSDNADFAVLDRLTESALDRLPYDAEVRCAT